MTYNLDLTPEQMRRIQAAEQRGIDVSGLIQGVIANLPEEPAVYPEQTVPVDEKRSAISYFQTRLLQAQNASPEELERADKDVAELMRNLNENRLATGERPLFPE